MTEQKRGNILVVDDEPGMREFLTFALTAEGYTVLPAANGQEALAHLQRHGQAPGQAASAEIDLTIMDIKMPPPGGIEVLRQLREADADAVVIMLTGYASLDTAMQAVRYGAYDYLTKPLSDVSELLSVVQRGLDKRRLLINNRRLLNQLRYAYEENMRLLDEMQAMNRGLEIRIAERTWELEKANRRLQELDRLKSELLANVSHELYTPLNSIIGFSQALLDGIRGPLTPEQTHMVRNIQQSGERLEASVNDLIDMAQLRADEQTLEAKSVSLTPLLQGMRALVERSAQAKGIELTVEAAPDVETVWADEVKLKRMLYELLGNAIRFTPEKGKVSLHASLHPPEGPRELRLVVSDTGIGIPDEELEAVFDPFQQVDSSLSRPFDGLGLGLAIVQHYAQLHGGRVWVESEPGAGSTFTLALPLASTAGDVDTPLLVKPGVGKGE
jgi:signal transduction histidine kinase